MTSVFPICILVCFLAGSSRFLFSLWKQPTQKTGNKTVESSANVEIDVFPIEETDGPCFHQRKQSRFLDVSSSCFLEAV
jgi:hypothetical protein